MTDLAIAAQQLAEELTETLGAEKISYLDVLDALASSAIKVSHAIWSWTAKRREAELAKCVVLCHACHVKRHREERPTHCKRGHELTKENTYVKPRSGGRRECRTCRKLRRIPRAVNREAMSATRGTEPSVGS